MQQVPIALTASQLCCHYLLPDVFVYRVSAAALTKSTNDVAAFLFAAGASAGVVQGSLQSPEDPQMGEHLAFLMGRSSRDARLYLRKWLRETLRQAGVQPKTRSKAGMPPGPPSAASDSEDREGSTQLALTERIWL